MTIENKHTLLPFDLQFFAEDPPSDPPADSDGGQDGEPEKVELTTEELKKKIEAESDRKLAKVLEKKQKEWDSLTEQKIQAALKEKERLSKLSEKERKEEELSKREQEIEKRLKEIELKELKADAVSDLADKGLPADFADFLLAENAEKTLENINSFKQAFDEAVNETVKEKLRQNTPEVRNTKLGSSLSTSKAEMAKKARII
ncbi:DUF4355 domain-containing protein [Virgibacillus pantothenticus]|uniref:DUF4355 domain-containing protein n=1 Tax=Virgibacillus pantothenticus TaxID=1473 RepID=UPI001C227DF1|nr:DUF4355 domain-containing protein [Virgibacillus pantothenticus]MBU8567580.1 DUF4355 domain-containing protein [Virgibacillus pantothenticus]MBU8601368.1 DUF4355 domain-containing protein [Virgibacillus pantothenticus]MBU8636185.1 DUF4355 domain-containing protein [Virgibacillus pantothenticus]MBU8643705.1 DUF4355 domain-containing protein [Virgibacillus pantothenticus]MBU8648039.1 DUF4355 domain-containing protein [Virgibacillus pantothenticus]